MPPRLPWRLSSHLPSTATSTSSPFILRILPSLFSQFPSSSPSSSCSSVSLTCQQQTRHASILANLADNPGAYNKRIRRGRGPASGKGKTSGRGHKGQKQHGKVPAGFNGGQTKDIVVHGERGFENIFTPQISTINLNRIQSWINQGRLDPSRPITLKELVKTRCIHGIKDGVKLLARSRNRHDSQDAESASLKQPVNIIVSRASASAIAAVEAAGGTVVTRYYTRHAIKRILSGKTDPYVSLAWMQGQSAAATDSSSSSETPAPAPASAATATTSTSSLSIGMGADKPLSKGQGFQYRLPDPTNRKDIEYYRDPAHRGYLSYLVGEGEGPSLFFEPPREEVKKVRKDVAKEDENRVW